MNDTSFTVIGDEPIEARIVAWVLGEASGFEAAELERLCEERPELLIFRRRMRALHGLLTEAEAAQPDEGWKLPQEKRKALDEVFGAEKSSLVEPVIERRIRRSGRRMLLAIAACLMLTFVVIGLFSTAGIRVQKSARMAEKRVDFMPGSSASDRLDSLPSQRGMIVDNKKRKSARRESDQSLAKNEYSSPSKSTATLATDLPDELIEGTPKPINVPNLETPANGPAGLASLDKLGADSATFSLGGRSDVAKDRDAESKAEDMPELALAAPASARQPRPRVTPPAGEKRVFAQGSKSTLAIPEPMDSFGEMSALSSLSGDGKAAGASGGSSGSASGKLFGTDNGGGDGANDDKGSTDEKIPTLGDVPMVGGLLSEQLEKQKELQVPKITTRSIGDDIDGGGREITAGNRSGDFANTRNNIDAVLNHPDRAAGLDEAEKLREVGKEKAVRKDLKEDKQELGFKSDVTNGGLKSDLTGLAEREMSRRHSVVAESDRLLASAAEPASVIPGNSETAALRKDIREQEDKVEENRKLLAMIVNSKKIIYRGKDSFYDQGGVDDDAGARSAIQEGPIKRGLDAQDYVDAKKDFEKDKELLQQLKLKLQANSQPAEPEKSKIDLSKLMEEISASEDPYSTFSLNISDASFKIAQAALAKGERPDPAGIKVEQFYNAVDYCDPSPSKGEPVAVNIEQSAHPVIPGRNLVRVALKTAATGRSASQPLRLTLLVDQSGSMVREDRRAAMDKALASLSGLLTKNDHVTVIGFSRTPRLLADGMTGDQSGKLKELVNQTASEGGTNLELAMKLAEQKAEEHKQAGAQNRIVLFTDGAANLGDANPARLAERVKTMRQNGIAFDIAGIAADDLNDDLLADLARNGNGRYYVVGKGDEGDFGKQLAGAFRPAAENVKVQVHFNPERVARYKLIGFEKDRLKTEDFRNDAVDAAELAAEEAGVAIYQVEPLPGGTGELGEVSVRFRDVAAGQMVERTWAIPHNAGAPTIDRASPSMQLAVLSMLAAEKLKGGPLAEAIDFKQLAAPRANVRHFYGNAGRAAEMLNMVDALK